MTVSKIRIRVGEVEVEYEGPQEFLDKKLPTLVSDLSRMEGSNGSGKSARANKSTENGNGNAGTLAAFIKEGSRGRSQTGKFLAAAEWLHRKGNNRVKTGDITKALRENNQGRLGNPADCLNKNVAKGFCEKDGRDFYVTDDGRKELGAE
jgi:hypothetical protein